MKFSAVLFAVGASASIVARQASTIQTAIEAIGSATSALNDAVTGYSGSGDLASLQSASQNVIDTVNQGNSDIQDVSELSLADALTLQEPAQSLGDLVSTASQAAIDKKDTFVADNLGPIILDQLNQIKEAADTFSATVVSKVPTAAQPIAQGLIQPITDALNKAIEAYADQEGATGPTSSAADPTSTPAPSTDAPSATPTPTEAPTSSAAPTGVAPTSTPPPFLGAASANQIGYAAAALALVAAL